MLEGNHIKKAYFSMGCFWSVEALFDSLDGVVKTYVGYTGGNTLFPTYNSIGDHLETLEVYYDSSKIAFENLLTIFEENHNYIVRPNLLQYYSAIFYNNENEKELCLDWKKNKKEELKTEVLTKISPIEKFYYAEFYHQKYYVQLEPVIMSNLRSKFSTGNDLISSPLYHKLNAYLAGYGSLKELNKEIEDFNLSEDAKNRLLSIVEGFNNSK
ncbi:peptide-methionine (S)-S-oxide reductase [Clostridium botulinum]|uniref:peptide-methionine (S)-S-oxide reductase n=1 Tax=Clostridium botulinum (strain Hall / ATCC 3502 / NCTC 13319 / Type A) TaxID=441771 RepID=A5I1M2_CLOBH|nr:peptide-methionine (S)-S-oxide reductase [Clostridium botulinum]ABS32660.1 putative methionine-S-sulfoxide reductase [Clostridium botulinum A str. ATCC 19397]ABS36995.1 putative methionine-S-sulfoxide reductase [Clostridium botulinum A str. Hall]AWB17353.1 peptide-methionine (S)-S-oxide reductase [Clostridium botulinum]AWB30143.1 peptide-methionine (S)-S-oxide reductase [Clostridium botulinum]EGT5616515.1 peptide-methionine (S)-S-oxide reductase [Clostridium botulinum]